MLLSSLGVPLVALGGSTSSASPVQVASHASSSRPMAFPPVHVHRLGNPGAATVNPTAGYSAEPAPMGIGDFGVGQGGNAYTYSTTEFLGNFSFTGDNIQYGGNTGFTDQLNVVLQIVQNGVTYAYWIQDVAFLDSSTNELQFENNIWNMTTSSSCLDNTAVSGNGTVYPISGCTGYYATGTNGQPGADVFLPTPGDFSLLVRSYRSPTGLPEVAFEYLDGVTSYYVTYDNVVWPWATAVTADNNFVVDGTQYNPGGWFYDAELDMGGPGGGSSTDANSPTHIDSSILYWNGHNFEAPPSVWNFGGDTGETIGNVQSIFSNNAAGLPLTLQLNGTAQNASPDKAYDQGSVGELVLNATGISSGYVAIPGDDWSFVNGSATLELVPGEYRIWVNSSLGTHDLGTCEVVPQTVVDVSVAIGCFPAVSTPAPSQPSADLGQSVTFQSTLVAPGSGSDTYVWHTSPSGLGCGASSTLTLSCTPSATGTYDVNVTVTDASSRSSTSATLRFTVYNDPTVGAPSPSRSSVETGASVTFTASPSGGAPSYSYSWSGLPSPCSQTATAAPACVPSTAGPYTVKVSVTDGSGYVVTSPGLAYTVVPGPAVGIPTAQPGRSIDLGQPVQFSTAVSGGSGGYSYVWFGLPPGCFSSSSATISCTPTAVGPSTVSVQVTDSSGGQTTSGALSFRVDKVPSIGVLGVARASIDLNQTLLFNVTGTTSGGALPYRYVWTGLPAGCVSANTTQLSCTPTAAGAGVAVIHVYDANNGTNSSSAPFQVFPDPTVGSFAASPAGIDLGQNVTFAATHVAGGSGTYTYRWTGLPSGCFSANASKITCIPTVVGTLHITLSITDSSGISVLRSATFTVYADPTVGAPTVAPQSGQVGESATFTVVASGGLGPLTYEWAGLPSGCASTDSANLTCTPSSSGTFHVTVTVTDANGVQVQSQALVFAVGAASATVLGLPPTEAYLVFAGIGLVVVAAAVVVVWRMRRGRNPS